MIGLEIGLGLAENKINLPFGPSNKCFAKPCIKEKQTVLENSNKFIILAYKICCVFEN